MGICVYVDTHSTVSPPDPPNERLEVHRLELQKVVGLQVSEGLYFGFQDISGHKRIVRGL